MLHQFELLGLLYSTSLRYLRSELIIYVINPSLLIKIENLIEIRINITLMDPIAAYSIIILDLIKLW